MRVPQALLTAAVFLRAITRRTQIPGAPILFGALIHFDSTPPIQSLAQRHHFQIWSVSLCHSLMIRDDNRHRRRAGLLFRQRDSQPTQPWPVAHVLVLHLPKGTLSAARSTAAARDVMHSAAAAGRTMAAGPRMCRIHPRGAAYRRCAITRASLSIVFPQSPLPAFQQR
ncbi:hypothetical protein B0H10DRAFT_1315725 [Mycena sp. CBHHK59/15]|nr:hypothetical protein B0H10DRAFT_1315725 [Mycena sp. CBHHK59/15]